MHAGPELACWPGACRVVAWASLESHLSLALTGAAGLDLPQQQLDVCDGAHSAGANRSLHVRQPPHCFESRQSPLTVGVATGRGAQESLLGSLSGEGHHPFEPSVGAISAV